MRSRHAVLPFVLLALAALSGCADPAGSIHMSPVEEIDLAEEVSRSASGGEVYPELRRQQVVSAAIENGSTTAVALREYAEGDYDYRYRGHYYDIASTTLERVPGVAVTIAVDRNATELEGPRYDYANLPAVDRELLWAFLEHEPRELEPGPDFAFPGAIRDEHRNGSEILEHAGSEIVVTYRGTRVQITIGESRAEMLDRHRYESSLLAESAGEYESYLTDRYRFEVSDPSNAERDVLESAAGDSYYAESTDDSGFAALVDRFRRHPAIRNDEYAGLWLVRYRGTTYLTELHYGMFADGETVTTVTPEVTPH